MEENDEGLSAGTPRDDGFHATALFAQLQAMSTNPAQMPPTIGTKGLFPMMDLPSELRLEIYNYLLIVPNPINLETRENCLHDLGPSPPRPSVGILQTCKEVNDEGTPILYSQNKFIVCLSINLNNFIAIDPSPSTNFANRLFLRSLRWTSISQLSSVSFISSSTFVPGANEVSEEIRPQPSFVCSGEDIISRFEASDFRSSPWGPDKYMALSISNWISMKVMREELGAFRSALQAMMSVELGGDVYGDNATS